METPWSGSDDNTHCFDPSGLHTLYFCGEYVCDYVEERNAPGLTKSQEKKV